MCSKCVYVDWEGRSLLPGNSPKTNREQDNDPQASAKMLRLLVSHWGFPRQQKKVKPLWADSDTSPGEGPRYDFCIIQRRSGTTCRGTELSEAFSEVKCWKWFPHVATEQGLPSDKTDAMMTSLMLSNHRAPDQLSSHVEHVKQRRGTWCIWLQASDWPLQPLCGEMKSFSCSLCSQLWCSVFFPPPPSVERATVAWLPAFSTLLISIFIESAMSATCFPLISVYCGEAHRCTEIWGLSSSAKKSRV